MFCRSLFPNPVPGAPVAAAAAAAATADWSTDTKVTYEHK